MNSVLERIGELETMLGKANETGKDVREKQASLSATDDQFKKLIEDIQGMIARGKSSGDPALDVVVMLGNTVVKDKPYQRLAWLQQSLSSRPGDLVCITGMLGAWRLAIIQDDRIGWNNTWNVEKGRHDNDVVLPTERFLDSGRSDIPADVPQRLGVAYGFFSGTFGKLPTDENPVISPDLAFHIGDEKVQAWAESLRPERALSVAAACRVLGKPLKIWPELAIEIRNLREAEVVWLLNQMSELNDLQQRLHRWQHDPASFLTSQRGDVEATENGVNIDFGLARPIREAKARLRGRVHVAVVLLEMCDNPTLQKAAEMCGYKLPDSD